MRLAPCGHQNNRTCISKFTEARSEPLNASHHCNNITNTFKLISSYYHLRRSRLAIRNISNLHQQVHRGSQMRAPGRERIASVATALQVVSTLFHFFYIYADRAPHLYNLSNFYRQIHRGSQRPQQSVIATLLRIVLILFHFFISMSLASRGHITCQTCHQQVHRGAQHPQRSGICCLFPASSFKIVSTYCFHFFAPRGQINCLI